MSVYTEKIQRGTDWLTERAECGDLEEYWFWDIDLDKLDMSYAAYCILGQLFAVDAHLSDHRSGYYYAQKVWLGYDGALYTHGFDVDPDDVQYAIPLHQDYMDLTTEWITKITALREAFPCD